MLGHTGDPAFANYYSVAYLVSGYVNNTGGTDDHTSLTYEPGARIKIVGVGSVNSGDAPSTAPTPDPDEPNVSDTYVVLNSGKIEIELIGGAWGTYNGNPYYEGATFFYMEFTEKDMTSSMTLKTQYSDGTSVTQPASAGDSTWVVPGTGPKTITSRTLTVSGSSPSGITSIKNSLGGGNTATIPNGIGTITYVITDGAGVTQNLTYNYKQDLSSPQILVVPKVGTGTWSSSGTAVWTVNCTDVDSGISSAAYSIGFSPKPISNPTVSNMGTIVVPNTTLTTGQSINLPGTGSADGYYYLLVNATNGAGTTSSQLVGPFQYEVNGPVMGTLSTKYPGDGTIAVTWTAATDAVSGLPTTPYTLSYTVNGHMFTVAAETGALSSTFNLDGLYGQTLGLTLTAVNNAGVASTTTTSVAAPPRLNMTTNYVGNDNQSMEVDVTFPGVSPQQMQNDFRQLVLTRSVSGNGGATLSTLTIDPTAIVLNADGTLNTTAQSNAVWTADASGSIEYRDLIPVSTGAGHKAWTYALSASPSTGAVAPQTVELPNNQGGVSTQIEDMSGNVYSPGSSAFHVYADGKVQIVIQGTDPDRDHWDYEIDRVTQTGPLTAYKSLSGTALLGYDGTASGTPSAPVTVTLRQGINNLSVFWEEGKDAAAVFHSAVESVDLEPASGGGYTISVTNQYQNPADQNSTGILTSPGATLNFSLDTSGLDPSLWAGITWTWNDGNPTSSGPSASHAYGQSPTQTGDTAEYSLSLTIPGAAPISLNVTVQDTQEGALLVPETWHGAHTVTGVVTVPSALSLTVASNASVRFQGGLGSGFGQGIDVQGTLTAVDGVTFAPAAGQTSSWGTILVEGTATIGADDISGATQGLSVMSTGTVTLNGTKLHDNQTGLHVTGGGASSPLVTVNNAVIAANTIYGIKEDSGGRPRLTGTSLTGNFRNYYSYDQNLLTIDQINALNAQAPAPNTGDANTGADQ